MRSACAVLLLGCAGGEGPLDTDVVGACAWDGAASLVAHAVAVTADPVPEGALAVGTPPQGGAPYLPFALQLRADGLGGLVRLPVDASVRGVDGAVLGDAETTMVPLCANAGAFAGSYWLGEIHLRFPGGGPDTLDGVASTVEITVSLPDGSAATVVQDGVLRWVGPGPAGDTDVAADERGAWRPR